MRAVCVILRSKYICGSGASDREFVMSLMRRTTEPGKFASFIAPPVAGINRQPLDFPYVRSN